MSNEKDATTSIERAPSPGKLPSTDAQPSTGRKSRRGPHPSQPDDEKTRPLNDQASKTLGNFATNSNTPSSNSDPVLPSTARAGYPTPRAPTELLSSRKARDSSPTTRNSPDNQDTQPLSLSSTIANTNNEKSAESTSSLPTVVTQQYSPTASPRSPKASGAGNAEAGKFIRTLSPRSRAASDDPERALVRKKEEARSSHKRSAGFKLSGSNGNLDERFNEDEDAKAYGTMTARPVLEHANAESSSSYEGDPTDKHKPLTSREQNDRPKNSVPKQLRHFGRRKSQNSLADSEDSTSSSSTVTSPRRHSISSTHARPINSKLGPDGFPRPTNSELHILGPGGRHAQFPYQPDEVLADVLCKASQGWSNVNVAIESKNITDPSGDTLDPAQTVGTLGLHQVLFGVSIEEWRKDFKLKSASQPQQALPSSSPAKTGLHSNKLSITLPDGTQSKILWDGAKTVQTLLEDTCRKRNISMEGRSARDKSGTVVDVSRTVSELGADGDAEIIFGSQEEWAAIRNPQIEESSNVDDVDETENDEDNPKNLASIISPRRQLTQQPQFLTITLPNEQQSKQKWTDSKTLGQVLETIWSVRQLKPEECEIKDMEGKRLDMSKTLGELGLQEIKISKLSADHASKPFCVYLPNGQMSNFIYEPDKRLREIIEKMRESRNDLQQTVTANWKVCDIYEKPLDLDVIKMGDIESRSCTYGTSMKDWTAKKAHRDKKSATRLSGRGNKSRRSSGVKPKDRSRDKTLTSTNPSSEHLKKMAVLRIYLPGGQLSTVPFTPEKELGSILKKVCSARVLDQDYSKMGAPTDMDGNKLNPESQLGSLTTMEVVFGTDMRRWTLGKGQDKVLEYLNVLKDAESADNTFKIYLPKGHISAGIFIPTKTLREVLGKVCLSRENLSLERDVAVDLRGAPLDLNGLLGSLKTREICFGTDILDWIITRHKNNNEPDQSDAVAPTIRERLDFLEELKTLLENGANDAEKDTARGSRGKKQAVDSSAPRSPKFVPYRYC